MRYASDDEDLTRARATIVIAPRETFAQTARSLESVYAETSPPFEVVYVDGGSPRRWRQYLRSESRRRGFTLIRTSHFLSPNEARNLGLKQVRTPYVVFVDNDVVVRAGWLDALVDCADSTAAAVVAPLCCIGQPVHTRIHTAGGAVDIVDGPGGRAVRSRQQLSGEPVSGASGLVRRPTGFAEFHCLLARTDVLASLGPLDEGLLSAAEHLDLCLRVRARGEQVYLEPDAVITYLAGPIGRADLRYFVLRWSQKWNAASIDRFRRSWDLTDDEGFARLQRFLDNHRRYYVRGLGLAGVRKRVLRRYGESARRRFDEALDRCIADPIVRWEEFRRSRRHRAMTEVRS